MEIQNNNQLANNVVQQPKSFSFTRIFKDIVVVICSIIFIWSSISGFYTLFNHVSPYPDQNDFWALGVIMLFFIAFVSLLIAIAAFISLFAPKKNININKIDIPKLKISKSRITLAVIVGIVSFIILSVVFSFILNSLSPSTPGQYDQSENVTSLIIAGLFAVYIIRRVLRKNA